MPPIQIQMPPRHATDNVCSENFAGFKLRMYRQTSLSHSGRVAAAATQPLSHSGKSGHSGPATQPLSHSGGVAGAATQPLSHSDWLSG